MTIYSRKFRILMIALSTTCFLLLSGWWLVRPAYAGTEFEIACSFLSGDAPDKLAEAIQAANESPGEDVILFRNDKPDYCQVALVEPLPIITDDLVIRGKPSYVVFLRPTSAPEFRIFHSQADLTVENVAIKNGRRGAWQDGGGILAQQALTLTDVLLTRNSARQGGAVYAEGPLTLEHVTVQDNSAIGEQVSRGGGIYAEADLIATAITVTGNATEYHDGISSGGGMYIVGSAVVSHATFAENKSAAHSAGGLYVGGDLWLTDSEFYSNTSNFNGGGLYVQQTLFLADSRFAMNRSGEGGGVYVGDGGDGNRIDRSHFEQNSGGGLYSAQPIVVDTSYFTANISSNGSGLYAAQAIIDNCRFVGNHPPEGEAISSGGGALIGGGLVQNSYFEGNSARGTSAVDGGGGLAVLYSATIRNNRFVSNTANTGGGLYILHVPPQSAASTIINNQFIDNAALDGAALSIGVGLEELANGVSTIYHNTIARREHGNGSALRIVGGTATVRNNIITHHDLGIAVGILADVTSDANLFYQNTQAYLGVSQGAQDLTADPLFLDLQNGDFRLQPESPGVDSGLDVGISEDFDGATRPQGKGFDRGAYEHAATNQAPATGPDSYTTQAETTLTVPAPGVLENDGDDDDDPLSALLVEPPAVGNLSLNQDGSFTYAPPAGFSGSASFTYRASDGQLESDPVAVTITVEPAETPAPPPPSVVDDQYTTQQDTPLVVAAPGVLGNDDVESENALSVVLESGPQQGALALDADGSFTYLPNPDYSGEDHFTYRARAGERTSDVATVTLVVAAQDPDEQDPGEQDPGEQDPVEDILLFIPKAAR